ncbi:hypothetical protein ACHAWF_012728 [Thalassiosira exigua]
MRPSRVYNSLDGEEATDASDGEAALSAAVKPGDGPLQHQHRLYLGQEGGNGGEGRAVAATRQDAPPNVQRARRLLYASHFVSQFSECAWQFAVVLFLAALSNYDSILLVSTYSLTTYAAVMLFGAPVGRFIDTADRLRAARLCISIENASVLAATIACCLLLSKAERDRRGAEDGAPPAIPRDGPSIALLIAVHFFGALAMLLNQGFVVAVERDWIVVLSRLTSEREEWLSRTNVTLRQIYLSCKVLSPTFAGWIVGDASAASDARERYCDLHDAAVLVGTLCVASLLVEYACAVRVYGLVPALAGPQRSMGEDEGRENASSPDGVANIEEDEACAFEAEWRDEDEGSIAGIEENGAKKTSIKRSFAIYWEQPIVCAGLSLAFVNSNALCFGGTMTTFLLWKGMPVRDVGFWRGLSSAVGLAGTVAYKWSARKTSVVDTGAWSVAYLFACLTLACLSFFVRDYDTSVYLLVASTAASRIGLWVFDISVTMLYQEMVPDGVRGLIGGTQQSLNSFFTMASGCLGLFFRRPEQFFVIAATGYACIGVATILYTVGVYRRGQQFFKPLEQQMPEAKE